MSERNEQFDEMVNDCFAPYQFGTMEFLPADILFHCDPIAYRCEVANFESEVDE